MSCYNMSMDGKNYAFIDGNNLYLGAKSQGIQLDYGKLRKYLRTKFNVEKAFLFIGYDPHNTTLYATLQTYGYVLIFKPTVIFEDENGNRTMKGNVDAELVLHAAAIEYNNYDQAVIMTSDGDFACLIRYLNDNNKLRKIVTPTEKFSKLLKPFVKSILPLRTIKNQINKNDRNSRSVQEP